MPRRRHAITASPRRRTGLALALVLGASLVALPAHASTESELDAAKADLEAKRAELTRITQRWQDTEARLATAQDAAARAQAQIDLLEVELIRLQDSLNDRVAAAYMSGGSYSMGALLTADSLQDATDRLQYTTSVVQGDADLATDVSVTQEELRRQEAELRRAARVEAAAAADLQDQRDELSAKVGELTDLVEDLRAELAADEEVAIGLTSSTTVFRSGAIQTCPVAGPNSFVDSFGDPRPDGRTHMGIDLIASAGTPVVAVAPGTARASSSIGGLGVVVDHPNGDWTFYAHLGSDLRLGPVSAGTQIGTIGSDGVSVEHLHFEYHPNGGAAVNPYTMLLAVC
jgi:murein DD-endopeptidase MepM/ murein hydrolase activator NlpD